jgi:penicillin-binding protein 2
VYFYKVGYQMGIDLMAEYARALGLGAKTGIDIPGEKEGLVPDKDWKRRVHKQPWMPGNTLSCAIGQGFMLASPLQMAAVYSVFANGGVLYRPQLLNRIEDQNGEVLREFAPEVLRTLNVNKRNLRTVHSGLVGVVNEPGGTGGRARLKSVTVAGKTGTSQVRGIGNVRMHVSALAYKHRDHAWFVCYAPAENPEIVVSVLVEHSGHGGVEAAPMAVAVLSQYFRGKADLSEADIEVTQVVGEESD